MLGSGRVAGKAPAQQPRSEPQSPSLAERTLTCDLRVSVLFPPFCAGLLMSDLVFCTQLWNQFTSAFLCPSPSQLKPEALPCPPLSHHTHSAAFKPQGLPCKQGPASSSPPDQSRPAGCGSPSCPRAVPPSSSLPCPRVILSYLF